jgi:murein DD-endopeptidase MepM/ murein hydrolase activator NlpD
MLGIALSFGTSAPLLVEPESALAAEGPVVAVLPTAGSKAELAQPVIVNQSSDVAATTYHTVKEGDSLWHIAAEHRADVHSIKAANGIAPDELLRVGQVLRVPSVLEGVASADGADPMQRLALRSNVRGGVGGDLSVVFGEELPDDLADGAQEGEAPETFSVARLDHESLMKDAADKPLSDQSYEMTAAALAEAPEAVATEPVLTAGEPENAVDHTVAALPDTLPDSLPLSSVEANPLAAKATVAAAPSNALENEEITSQPVVEDSAPLAEVEAELPPQAAEPADTWQNREIEAVSGVTTPQVTEKPLTAVVLGTSSDDEVEISPEAAVPTSTTQAYRVKAGDTFWNIANRHGLSLDDLMRHNAGRNPEELLVGDSINLPISTAQATPEASATLARTGQLQSETSRDAAIRDHLARIREAANREVDQEELKARIIAVRQSLEQAEANATGAAPLEYHSSSEESDASLAGQSAQGLALAESGANRRPSTARLSASTQIDWTVTDAARDTNGAQLAAVTTRPESTEALSESPSAPAVPTNLMAAAPMSPDVYRATPQLPIGETVTPGMPILPDSGEFLPEAPNRFNGYVWPAQGVLTSGYGWRWGRMHRGIDIAGPVGTPIMAAASGVVVRSGWNSGGYGNLVDIRHADGSMTRYAHNSRLLVREGQQVRQGQQIAEMGSTGFSTGPHVHFEVHLPNTGTVNPMAYLPGR